MFKRKINTKPGRLYYAGNDLGLTFSETGIKYKIWSPPAIQAFIEIYADDQGNEKLTEYQLKSSASDTWQIDLPLKYYGNYYQLRLKLENQTYNFVDPWAKAVGTNSNYALIVNPNQVYPKNWNQDQKVKLENPVDAIIYELHVKDFSAAKKSGITNKGKYISFTEKNTYNSDNLLTGISHLKELGITHVHLLPVYDFASVDDLDPEAYNWGYDPFYYQIPEGSYASNPADESRIYEFKQMVQALHSYDIGVVMDVVYNHTYDIENSPFQKIFPDYFYRFTEKGDFANASGCGNEIATEKEMMRKYIIDSLLYWSREYHIDGFRFDLMASIDRETMLLAAEKLKQENKSVLIYGEPWTALEPQLEPYQQLRKGDQKGTGISVFNDNFRNALKGDSDGTKKGFIQAEIGLEPQINEGIIGTIGLEERRLYGFALQPSESINYVEAHDNLTLWDKLSFSCPGANEKQRQKMYKLAQVILFTAQGVPFISAGTEFLRTKFGDENSYKSAIEVNQLKWERKNTYYSHFKYIQGLINLRSHHPAFRMKNKKEIKKNLHFIDSPLATVGFGIFNNANGDAWHRIFVLLNPTQSWKQFYLPENRNWAIVVDDQIAGTEPIRFFHSDEVFVPPITGMVIYDADLISGY